MSGSYQGWTNWDTWETWLVLENDEESYRNLQAWALNFRRKIKRGVFDRERAQYAVRKYLIPQARKFDENINPHEVNTDEIVDQLLEMET